MRRLIGAVSVAGVLVGAVFTAAASAKPFAEVIVLPERPLPRGSPSVPDLASSPGICSRAISTGVIFDPARPPCSWTHQPAGWPWA